MGKYKLKHTMKTWLFVLIAVTVEEEEEEALIQTNSRIDWEAVDESEDGPPEPVFNSGDNSECRSMISYFYEEAASSYEWALRSEAKLNASYQGLLDRQTRYRVNLANNEDIKEFTLTDFHTDGKFRQGDPDDRSTWSY